MYYYPQTSYQLQQQYYNEYLNRKNEGTYQKVFTAILNAIQAEATAIDFYSRLVKYAPNKKHKEDILHALEDEKIHLKEFTELYINLTGQQPKYTINKTKFNTYKEGLETAYKDELEAYEEYRNAYLLTQNSQVRDVFLRAFTDEIEHATRFGFLKLYEGA